MNHLLKKLSFVLLAVLITAGGIFALSRKPKTVEGIETFSDQGRNHVPDGTVVEYNSNPPTSGPHSAIWEKPGIYNNVLEDGKLIHSLEHGYVIISYNCDKKQAFSPWLLALGLNVYAHETDEPHEEIPASDSAEIKTGNISGWKDDPDCQNLVGQIKQITKKTGINRLIVVPRPNLDAPIAMTAWTKLMKLNTAEEDKIIEFIKLFRNKGPEKTME
ncbi:DUF3105 domain-containing protein [Candidatus Collierbacteria bacterium]|nr:DUF3105 domain-containing protein [Candidatus Collierbacteria bacterium]